MTISDLFNWRPHDNDEPVRLDGSILTLVYEESGTDGVNREGRIMTTNPLPRSLGSFSFEISSLTPTHEFAVGYATSSKSVVYEAGTGLIVKETRNGKWMSSGMRYQKGYEKRNIENTEKCSENDVIQCSLAYTTARDIDYATVLIKKNGTVLARHAIETSDVAWPVISLSSSETKINTVPRPKGNGSEVVFGKNFVLFFHDSFHSFIIRT